MIRHLALLFALLASPALAGGYEGTPSPGAGSPSPVGPQGDPGCSVLPTNGPPTASYGLVCDFAFDAGAGAVYGPKTTSGWGAPLVMTPVQAAQTAAALAAAQATNAASSASAAAASAASLPTLGTGVASALGNAAGAAGGFATYGQLGSAAFQSPSSCSNALTWTGSAFGCNSSAATGTITNIATGNGLVGGPITSTGTISKDYSTDVVRVRQTVTSGPVDGTYGLPTLLPVTNSALSIATQNLSSSAPLCVTAANGYSASPYGELNYTACITSSLAWSGLPESATDYLYVTLACAWGSCTITPGATTLEPVYEFGGTPSTTSGQFTFNISSMKGYLGNGSTAPQAYVVFIGEVVTSSSAVTSSIAYAYNGVYDSNWTSTLPSSGTEISKNANLGLWPGDIRIVAQNLTSEGNYSVGDQIVDAFGTYDSASLGKPMTKWANRNVIGFAVGNSSAPWVVGNKTTGALLSMTLANWQWKLLAGRGW